MRKYIYVLSFSLFIFGITPVALRATPGDPKIIVSGGGDATNVTSSEFTFMSDPLGGGVLSFVNGTSFDWLSLDFFVTLPSGSQITCLSQLYNTCDVSFMNIRNTNLAAYDIGFENAVNNGLLPGETLTVNLNDQGNNVNGSGGWGANNSFTAVINLPEPSSFFFLAGGILLLGALRLIRRGFYF